MKPILFSLGPIHIHSFGLMVALGVLIALHLMTRRLSWLGLKKTDSIFDLTLAVVLFGFLGARVAYIIQKWDWYRTHLIQIFAIWEGGLIFYGGVIGAFLGLWIFSRKHRLPLLTVLDFFAPFVALGHTFGRLGCFLNGCCYGKMCSLPWAVQFQELHHPVHPTQLYEAIFTGLLFFGLLYLFPRRKFQGQVAAAYFIFYGLGRFVIEIFRYEEPLWLSLTWNQWFSAVLIFVSVVLYHFFNKRKSLRGK